MKTSINLIQAPNQTLSANITDINGEIHIVDINLRTLYDGQMIADISIDGTAVFYGRRCIDRMPLMLGGAIPGNFYFVDLFGNSNPVYTDLGNEYLLIYDDEYQLR